MSQVSEISNSMVQELFQIDPSSQIHDQDNSVNLSQTTLNLFSETEDLFIFIKLIGGV